jgi:hypothetical protein
VRFEIFAINLFIDVESFIKLIMHRFQRSFIIFCKARAICSNTCNSTKNCQVINQINHWKVEKIESEKNLRSMENVETKFGTLLDLFVVGRVDEHPLIK